MGLSVK